MRTRILIGVCLPFLFVSCEGDFNTGRDSYTLPVIELSIDEEYLWSADSGLYVFGENGSYFPGCPGIIANFNEDWEFPVAIRYFIDGELQFDDRAGFRIKGNCSRMNSQKSIGIYWRHEYGDNRLEYPLFPGSPVTNYKRLFLRNSGNDFGKTHIKDAAISQIYKDYAHVDYQEYQPCVLFLNDEYWGIINMREMITRHHFKYHYGVDDEAVDILVGSEKSPFSDDGSTNDYIRDIVTFMEENDLSVLENYQTIAGRIDIESYIDYIIIETYICNTDWPSYNAKWWRDKTSPTHYKWRWVIYDTDYAFLPDNVENIWIGDLYSNFMVESKQSGFYLFNHLIRNNEFRQQFLSRYLFFIDTVFEKERVERIIRSVQENIADEYPYHQEKWNTLPVWQWEKKIDEMIEFNNQRNTIMHNRIIALQNE